jgi:hypothetical protein
MMLPVIAKDAGMDEDATLATISKPSSSPPWTSSWVTPSGWAVARRTFMKGVADVFVEAGSIDAALESYDRKHLHALRPAEWQFVQALAGRVADQMKPARS